MGRHPPKSELPWPEVTRAIKTHDPPKIFWLNKNNVAKHKIALRRHHETGNNFIQRVRILVEIIGIKYPDHITARKLDTLVHGIIDTLIWLTDNF
ncbi:hypothetical protein D9M71_669140 [compost metagenome]